MSAILDSLLTISADLATVGVPPLSPYWRGEAERFYTHPTARVLTECVGRGGDKSRTSVMMAIAETLAGDFHIAPGERHYFTHVSENREEAAKTLGVLEQYLRILRIGYGRTGDTIELEGMPRGFKVLAARVGAVSGWRSFGWTCDEAAKWSDDGVDPSAEVVASIRAMTVTHPSARGRIVSSPLATLGYFYETWHAGESDSQLVGHAPSWVANPSITEEQTRRLEKDPRKHSREYGAKAAEAHEEGLVEADLLDRAMRKRAGDLPREPGVLYSAAMDPSLGRNAWTFVIGAARDVDGRSKASIVLHREWRAPKGSTLDMAAILETIGQHCASYGISEVRSDQYHAESLSAIAERLELGYSVAIDKPTQAERLKRYEGLLTRFLDDAIELPRDKVVRADLLAIRRRITKGSDSFGITMAVTPDGRHADFAPAISLVLERIAVDDAPAGWLRAGMRRAKAKAAAAASLNPRDADDGDRRSDLGSGFTKIKMKYDTRYCRPCNRMLFGTSCQVHGEIPDPLAWMDLPDAEEE